MALELKQTVKLTQSLVMTPQLQQAIKLLQLSRLELQNTIQQELVENPVLEEALEDEAAPEEIAADENEPGEVPAAPEAAQTAAAEAETATPSTDDMVGDLDWESYMESKPQTSLSRGDDDRPALDANLTPATSLNDHLIWQLGFVELEEIEREIALRIVWNLNDDGYLQEDLEAIAAETKTEVRTVEKVLARVQELDPVGVAARSLAECLLIQMRVAGVTEGLAVRIITQHLDALQKHDFRGIARMENCELAEVAAAAKLIGSFEPRPGRQFAGDEPVYITPDIFVHKLGDEYHVVLNEDGMPKLRVSLAYKQVLANKDGNGKQTREYVREKLRSAVWLIKSIHQRQRTIVRVMESIIRFQREFFDKGPEHLRPLNLRDVADDIGMHESTVSRVTTNKYTQTPHGVFELKFFFNSSIRTSDGDGIASESVKEKILQIIRAEDSRNPLSDQKIAELLSDASIQIARRTVTKYREALRILSSTQRRQIG
ncbi:MAG TPA: RNA polymerase factor sigma-54 [Myxococcota bacterium]|nr:RNA polymerase factor sigma-54 [Myxococcota bacterium]